MEESKGRKLFLIDPEYQISIIFHFLVLFFCIMIVTILAINWQLEPVFDQVKLSQLSETDPLFQSLYHFSKTINITMIAVTGFSFLMFIFMGLIVSHKSAGPIYKLKMRLQEMRTKNQKEAISFRKGDYFQELADEINKFIEWTDDKK